MTTMARVKPEALADWVVSTDTSEGNKFVENVATFENYKFANV